MARFLVSNLSPVQEWCTTSVTIKNDVYNLFLCVCVFVSELFYSCLLFVCL